MMFKNLGTKLRMTPGFNSGEDFCIKGIKKYLTDEEQ